VRPSSPHDAHNEEGGSPKDPKVGYKYNVTPQGLKMGKNQPSAQCSGIFFEGRWKIKMI
jgi:hypothetical protein